MKKKNGFTLVELLAVIVVLAIIMIIAIPSVLDVMNTARKKSFAMYINKFVTAVQTQYVYDSNIGDIKGAGIYVYSIKDDLNLTTSGDYRGFVTVDATHVDEPKYIISMYDKNYMISNYHISDGMPDATNSNIHEYSGDEATSQITQLGDCKELHKAYGNANGKCISRKGYELVES